MRTRLRHIKSVKKTRADGAPVTYFYHRHTGRRIVGEPGSPEFLLSYSEAAKPVDRIPSGTILAAIRDYKSSTAFSTLAASTRKGYTRSLDAVASEFGSAPLAIFEDKRIRRDIRKWRDTLAGTVGPREADYAVTVLARMIKLSYDDGLISVNHAARIGAVYKADRSENIWSNDEIKRFITKASPEISLGS